MSFWIKWSNLESLGKANLNDKSEFSQIGLNSCSPWIWKFTITTKFKTFSKFKLCQQSTMVLMVKEGQRWWKSWYMNAAQFNFCKNDTDTILLNPFLIKIITAWHCSESYLPYQTDDLLKNHRHINQRNWKSWWGPRVQWTDLFSCNVVTPTLRHTIPLFISCKQFVSKPSATIVQ